MSRSQSLKGNRNAVGMHNVTRYRDMTREKADEIRRLYFSRQYNQPQLAQMFGRTQATISRIVSGKVWA